MRSIAEKWVGNRSIYASSACTSSDLSGILGRVMVFAGGAFKETGFRRSGVDL
jgi:hypothetical protein